MKVMSAIQARLHASLRQELRLLSGIIRDYDEPVYPYEIKEGSEIKAEDFDNRIDVIPVSDPNANSMAQRIMQSQAALQLSSQAPQLYDMKILHRQMLESMGVKNVDEIIKPDEAETPADPVQENMNVVNLKPVKAFAYQDHKAHIATHIAFMQSPAFMGLQQTILPLSTAVTSSKRWVSRCRRKARYCLKRWSVGLRRLLRRLVSS